MIDLSYSISAGEILMACPERLYMLKWTDYWPERGYALIRRYIEFVKTKGVTDPSNDVQLQSISIGDGVAYMDGLRVVTIYNPRGIARITIDT